MEKDIIDKLALKNSENLSAHKFENDYTLGMSSNLENLKINDDSSNEDTISRANIESRLSEEDEELSRKNKHEDSEDIKVEDLPIFPNLSE